MSRILGTGIATLDIIHSVDGYPAENSEVRAVARHRTRGGNTANTLSVLRQLGHQCSWAGVYTDDEAGRFVCHDLQQRGIELVTARLHSGKTTPTSSIVHNRLNGSRTIIHYRDLPELGFAEFSRLDLGRYDWLHFEGRNVTETARMLSHAAQQYPDLPRSVEIEKPRDHIESLFALADVLVFSRDCLQAWHEQDPQACLRRLHDGLPGVALVCTWGESGAFFVTGDGVSGHAPAHPPGRVVDTLGAGDTFNAGLIDALLQGHELAQATTRACRLAGQKCGHQGLDFIATTTADGQ